MTTLGGTVTLADPHHVALLIADDLHLDVARPREVALHVDLVATEEGLGLALRRFHHGYDFVFAAHHLHTATAASVRGLDRDRVTELGTERLDLVGVLDELDRAGHAWHAGVLGRDARRNLVAHDIDGAGWRADEGHALFGDGPSEVGVLGEEAVAGMHAVGARTLDGVEDGRGVQVTLGRRGAAEGIGLVGQTDVQRVPIGLRVDRNGLDSHLAGSPDDPNCYLATVRNQDFGEHKVRI
jgi:hypothetical protein